MNILEMGAFLGQDRLSWRFFLLNFSPFGTMPSYSMYHSYS